ncbi:MAG: hypothetical protein DLM57_08030 [Pseudonocardiales bacterium]|nr:MAG: hypothetical protein DLM57_08030 [Pseudonocardiales bacterium]
MRCASGLLMLAITVQSAAVIVGVIACSVSDVVRLGVLMACAPIELALTSVALMYLSRTR